MVFVQNNARTIHRSYFVGLFSRWENSWSQNDTRTSTRKHFEQLLVLLLRRRRPELIELKLYQQPELYFISLHFRVGDLQLFPNFPDHFPQKHSHISKISEIFFVIYLDYLWKKSSHIINTKKVKNYSAATSQLNLQFNDEKWHVDSS